MQEEMNAVKGNKSSEDIDNDNHFPEGRNESSPPPSFFVLPNLGHGPGLVENHQCVSVSVTPMPKFALN